MHIMKKILLIFITLPLCYTVSAESMHQDSISQDSIYRNVKLDSIVVTGQRPLMKSEGSKQTVTVKGSYLSRMGTLGNMLAFTPGMSEAGANNFVVVGKGTPKYYIDGREVTVQDIFTTVKADNIDKIEIEREPSAEYPTGTNAVVNIITVKPLKDFISLDVSNYMTVRRKFSDLPTVAFKMKKGIWSWSLQYGYSASNNLNKETYFTEIFSEDTQASRFRSDAYNNNRSSSSTHTVTWANDLNINKNHKIGFAYYFEHRLGKTNNDETVRYSGYRHYADRDVSVKDRSHSNVHNFTLDYFGKTGKESSVSVSADYSIINRNSTTGSYETNLETAVNTDIFTGNKTDYGVLTLNAGYSFVLPWNVSANVGGRYYNVESTSDHDTDNPRFTAYYASNRQKTRDNVSAGYFTLTKRFGRVFTVRLGGRYEYTDTRMTVYTADRAYTARRHTSDFLPSVTLQLVPGNNLVFQLIYNRSVARPGYMGMNPYPTYQDSLSYNMGNIDLRSSITDRYTAYVVWKRFTASFGYSQTKDAIRQVVYNVDPSSDVVNDMPVNFGRNKCWFATLSYYNTFGKLNFNGSITFNLPRDKYEFLGKTYHADKISCDGSFNLSYPIRKWLYVYTSYSFQSYNENIYKYQHPASDWTVGAQAVLLKNRLTLNLRFTDILHDANYNNITFRYVNTMHGTYGTNDMRGVMLTATLNLFNREIKVGTTRRNSDVINRTM